MMPLQHLLLSAASTLALAAAPSQAAVLDLAGFGTQVTATTAGNCPSFCTGNQFAVSENGGSGLAAAAAAKSTYAIARGSAAFAEGSSYLPVLKAYGSAPLGKRGAVSSFASQRFEYTGAARTADLKIDLTGTVISSLSGYSSNTISASIAIVSAAAIPWLPSFSSLIYEAIPAGSLIALGSLGIVPGTSAASTTLSFAVNPGDSFFVVAQLDVNAQNGIADAENTLVMAFDAAAAGSGGLLPSLTAVPEPGTAPLAAVALLAVVGTMRSRQRRAHAN